MNDDIAMDLSVLMPQVWRIKAGDKVYDLNSDLPTALLYRCQRWISLLQTVDESTTQAESDEIDRLSVQIVRDALRIDESEARTLGAAARMRLIAFLGGARPPMPTQTRPSEAA